MKKIAWAQTPGFHRDARMRSTGNVPEGRMERVSPGESNSGGRWCNNCCIVSEWSFRNLPGNSSVTAFRWTVGHRSIVVPLNHCSYPFVQLIGNRIAGTWREWLKILETQVEKHYRSPERRGAHLTYRSFGKSGPRTFRVPMDEHVSLFAFLYKNLQVERFKKSYLGKKRFLHWRRRYTRPCNCVDCSFRVNKIRVCRESWKKTKLEGKAGRSFRETDLFGVA